MFVSRAEESKIQLLNAYRKTLGDRDELAEPKRSQLQEGEEGAQPGAGPGRGVRALPWHELKNLSAVSSSKTKCPLEAVIPLESIQE